MEPYVPKGFTREDVRRAALELPDAHRFYLTTSNSECAICLHDYPDADYVKPTESFLENKEFHQSTVMRILYFKLYRTWCWKENKVVYAWACSGSNK